MRSLRVLVHDSARHSARTKVCAAEEMRHKPMRTRSKFVAAVALAAVGGLALSGCTSTTGDSKLIDSASLTACSEAQYPPFERPEGDKIVGIDADISSEIAKDLGVDLKQVNTAFEGLQSGQDLDNKKCDIAISAITINDERKTKMDFSEPYFHDDLAVVVPKGSSVTSADQALDGTHTIAVQDATTGQEYVTGKGLQPQGFDDATLAATKVSNGSLDVLIDQVAPASEHLKNFDNLQMVATIPTGESYGIAVRKGNSELLDSVNKTLKRIQGDGTLQSIFDKYGVKATA